jgi:hypothetical protein
MRYPFLRDARAKHDRQSANLTFFKETNVFDVAVPSDDSLFKPNWDPVRTAKLSFFSHLEELICSTNGRAHLAQNDFS